MKKILIISYLFPPSAKAGAHRALSMAQWLPKYGWEPIFMAPEKGYYGRTPRFDESLLDVVRDFAVYRTPSFYPFNHATPSKFERAVHRLWETVMLPDGRILWNRGIKKNINEIIDKHRPHIIFLTATPFSTFLLAPFLKSNFGLPVVLDYRDPWALTPAEKQNRLRSWLCLIQEKKALNAADLVTTASYHAIDYIKKAIGELGHSINFWGFPYGFDRDFFNEEILPIQYERGLNKIIGTFAGFVHGDLSAETVMSGIKMAVDNNKVVADTLKINCYGTLFGQHIKNEILISKYNLNEYIEVQPFLPYIGFLKTLRQSYFSILPLCVKGHYLALYPTKLFDYFGVQRPILYIGGEGQVSETIRNLNAGICSGPEPEAIAESLISMVRSVNSKLWYNKQEAYEKFDRKTIFAEFCAELDKLI